MTSITMTRDDLLHSLQTKRAEAVAGIKEREKRLNEAVPAARARVFAAASRYTNIGSPKQLATLREQLDLLATAERNLSFHLRNKRNGYDEYNSLSRFDTAIRAVKMASNDTFKISLNGRNDFASLLNI